MDRNKSCKKIDKKWICDLVGIPMLSMVDTKSCMGHLIMNREINLDFCDKQIISTRYNKVMYITVDEHNIAVANPGRMIRIGSKCDDQINPEEITNNKTVKINLKPSCMIEINHEAYFFTPAFIMSDITINLEAAETIRNVTKVLQVLLNENIT